MRHSVPNAGAINLREVLPKSQFFGTDGIRIASCCGDSRHCKEGDLFAALVSEDGDGHDDADDAIRRGAAAILTERLLPVRVPNCVVEDSREAYGRICHALMDNPCNDMHVIGITGTHGKTTTAMLMVAVLEAVENRVGIASSLGYCDSENVDTQVNAACPTAPEFVRWLAAMRDRDCSHAVVETPSEGLARHSFAGMQLDGAIITNVRRAHLDLHGSVLAYRKIKQRILSYLKPGGFAIVNVDDPASRFVLGDIDHPVLTFGMQNPAEVTATMLERQPGEQTFLLHAGSESLPVRTKMIGYHHVQNCLAVTAVGLVAGLDLATIARGLEAVDSLPGRMERLECGQPFATFVDGANTADGLAVALKTARQVATGRVICVFGSPGKGDVNERPMLGRVAERNADLSIITRNNPQAEDPMQIAHDILDGYDRPARAQLIPDRARAIGWALNQAEPGDVVLIAGRGNESSEVVNGKRVDFDDRHVARFFLEEIANRQNEQTAKRASA